MTLIGVKIDRLFLRDLFILLVGVGLYILSIQLFVVPNAMASNGIAGFSVFIHFVFGMNPALTFFAVNIPLFLLSWKLLEQRELLLTIPGALAMSAADSEHGHATLSAWVRAGQPRARQMPVL